jgi:hypothetical protein
MKLKTLTNKQRYFNKQSPWLIIMLQKFFGLKYLTWQDSPCEAIP